MTDLMRYASELEGLASRKAAPVEKWNPDYCGELDLTIRSDGLWIYQGTPIGRARLVRLFSSVLRREGDRYFLVTPVEKLGITVEDAPFLAVLMRAEGDGANSKLIFTTNVGEEITAGPGHPISSRARSGGEAPYIRVRGGLDALIARPVFFDLVELGETREVEGVEKFGVYSDGMFFPLANAEDVYVDGNPETIS